MQDALVHHGLPLAALLVFISSMGIPTGIPVKAVLLAAGSLVVASPGELGAAFALLVLAELAGAMTLYAAAGYLGTRLPDRLESTQQRAQSALDRWRARLGGRDVLAIFVLRLTPVVRIGLTVGAAPLGVTTREFVLGAVPAALIWIGLPLGLGWFFRDSIHSLESALAGALGPAAAAILVVALIVAAAAWKRRRSNAAADASLPESAPMRDAAAS